MMTLAIFAANGVKEADAKAAIKAATGDKIADIFIGIILAGVKSGAVKPEAAAKQLADMATADDKADTKAAVPVAQVTNNADNGAIIVSGAGNTINFVAPGSVVSGNGKKTKGGKGNTGEGEKKAKMTAEESDAALNSATHAVAVWYPKDTKTGQAIYKVDGDEPVVFDFSEPKEISDTVTDAVKDLDGTIACNNPFVVKALGEDKGIFAANSKGSKMLKAVKALGDLVAASGATEGSGNGSGSCKTTAPKGAEQPPKSNLSQKAAQRAAAAQAAAQQQAQQGAGEELELEEAPAQTA